MYIIHFYAIRISDYQRQISELTVVDQVVAHAHAQEGVDSNELSYLREILEAGLRGTWPSLRTRDAFIAFDWLLATIAENVSLDAFQGVRHWCFWEAAGLCEAFRAHPPFAIPRFDLVEQTESQPHIGYLPHQDMAAVLAAPEPEGIPRIDGIYAARLELLELIESLSDESLDLVLVCLGSE